MPEYLYEILKALGALIFIYPTFTVFRHYMQAFNDNKCVDDAFQYHFPTLYKIIEKYKKDE